MTVCFHLKVSGSHTFSADAVKRMHNIYKTFKGKHKPIYFSYNKDVIKRLKKYSWRKAYLSNTYTSGKLLDALSFAKANNCKYIIHPYSVNNKPSKKALQKCNNNNIKVMCYNINSQKEALDALNQGEDYLITNRVLFQKAK